MIFRCVVAVAMAAGVHSVATAQANDPANLNAYNYSLRCFTTNTVSTGDNRYNPNGRYDGEIKNAARRAYDAALAMGKLLGYSSSRVADDVTKSGNVDGALMLRNDAYFQRARSDCRKLGML